MCISCYEQVTSRVPAGLQTRVASLERVVVSAERLSIPSSSRGQSSSQLSDLAEYIRLLSYRFLLGASLYLAPRCPVCNHNLDNFGTAAEQEAHVKHCLDGGSSSAPQAAKYLVYRLPAESTLISVECSFHLQLTLFRADPCSRCHLSGRVRKRFQCSSLELSMLVPQLYVMIDCPAMRMRY